MAGDVDPVYAPSGHGGHGVKVESQTNVSVVIGVKIDRRTAAIHFE